MAAVPYASDFGDDHSGDLIWHARFGTGGKQELVLISPVEREFEISLAGRAPNIRSGDGLLPKLSTHTTFLANMRKIG